ncbi:MAG: hypothetical protein RIT14_2891, partial [Pseudomonadota bacterium]
MFRLRGRRGSLVWYAYVVLLGLAGGYIAMTLMRNEQVGRPYREELAVEVITDRVRTAVFSYMSAFSQDWQHLRALALAIGTRELAPSSAVFDTVVGNGSRISWAGLASADGIVIADSGDLLKGRDVSQRPWFQAGLEGDFAGDVHEAVLLAEVLGKGEDEPFRLFDFATPVRGSQDVVLGVLGVHINYDWAKELLADAARQARVDLFLLSRTGDVVIATDGFDYAHINLPVVTALLAGQST